MCLIFVDQTSKQLLPTVFLNQELSFGLPFPYFSLLGLVAAVLLVRIYNLLPTTYNLPASLLLAGGLSNLADRLLWSGVRDIFAVGPVTFNIADIYIVGGSLMLLWYLALVDRASLDS